jgi:hypothetical protein
MHRTQLVTLMVVSLVLGYLGRGVTAGAAPAANGMTTAQNARAPVKYAYVVGQNGRAFICFAEADGCRMQEVTAPPVMMTVGVRSVTDVFATQAASTAKAIASLGDAGWEMIGVGPAYATYTTEHALHFRLASR